MAFLSGGTDGEDGPTDAAGAFFDAGYCAGGPRAGLSPREFLARNDAYHFFAPLDALLKTGPTHTNVCDLRVVVHVNERRWLDRDGIAMTDSALNRFRELDAAWHQS